MLKEAEAQTMTQRQLSSSPSTVAASPFPYPPSLVLATQIFKTKSCLGKNDQWQKSSQCLVLGGREEE